MALCAAKKMKGLLYFAFGSSLNIIWVIIAYFSRLDKGHSICFLNVLAAPLINGRELILNLFLLHAKMFVEKPLDIVFEIIGKGLLNCCFLKGRELRQWRWVLG